MTHWIYCFREGDRRELSEDERRDFARLYRRKRSAAILQGLGAALFTLPFIVGIAIVAGGAAWGWVVIIVSVVLGSWTYAGSTNRDRLALLYRRASRLGNATSWHRDEAPIALRRLKSAYKGPHEPDEGEPEEELAKSYWLDEERFDRLLEWTHGLPVNSFETVDIDGVLLTIEGRRAPKVIEGQVWEIADGEGPGSET